MTNQSSSSLSRLASANPVAVNDDLGRTPQAQTALGRIIGTQRDTVRLPRPRVGRRLAVALAVMLVGGGGAFAATDPFGWWRSPNPETALYRPNPGLQVKPPTATSVRCRRASNDTFRCGARAHGRPYELIDHVDASPKTNPFSRASISRFVSQALASGHVTATIAQRVRRDLADVSNGFLSSLYDPRGYGTYGLNQPDSGVQLVPPLGIPSLLACRNEGAVLGCQNLNGDENVPTGAGIYMAQQTADWRPAPPARRDPTPPQQRHYTPAEIRLLSDIGNYVLTVGSSSSSGPSASSSGP